MKIYKITEASEYLGVSINTLKTLANNGKIKSFKTTGEHRRFRQEDLDAYMGVEKEKQEKLTEIEIFEGEEVEHKIGDFVPWIVDGITDKAFEAVGEHADSWSNKIENLEKEIQDLIKTTLNNWADQTNNQPNFYGVKNVRPILVKIKVDESGNWEDIS